MTENLIVLRDDCQRNPEGLGLHQIKYRRITRDLRMAAQHAKTFEEMQAVVVQLISERGPEI